MKDDFDNADHWKVFPAEEPDTRARWLRLVEAKLAGDAGQSDTPPARQLPASGREPFRRGPTGGRRTEE